MWSVTCDAHRTFTPRACRASIMRWPIARRWTRRMGGTDHPRPSCGEETTGRGASGPVSDKGRQLGDRAFIRPIVLLGGHARNAY